MSSSIVHTLTEIQIEEFREAFNAFDKDGGGSIDKFELMDLFKSLGQNPSEEELDNMIRCADTDGNGTIDFYEFSTLMAHLMFSQDSKEAKCERLRAAFKIFDTDNNGTISTDEMRNIMYNLGEECTLDDVDDVVGRFDVNGDGVIDYQEFASGIVEEKLLRPGATH